MNFKKKINKYFVLAVLCVVLFGPDTSFSQLFRRSEGYQDIGINLDYNYNFYRASFSKLPGVPNCCEGFSNSTGSGLTVGGVYDYFFSTYGFQISGGLNFHSGNFDALQEEVLGINGVPVDGQFDHHINFNLKNFNLEAAFSYNFTDKINLSLGLGAFYYYSSHFDQYEKIVKPAGKATFLDSNGNNTGSAIRNNFSGKLPDINKLQTYATAKIGYELPDRKDRSMFLRPEIGIDYTFSQMIKQLDWKLISLKFGVSLIFTSAKYEEIISRDETGDILNRKLELKNKENDSLRKEREKELADKKILEAKLRKDSVEKAAFTAELSEMPKQAENAVAMLFCSHRLPIRLSQINYCGISEAAVLIMFLFQSLLNPT